MIDEIGEHFIFISWAGKIVEVTLQKAIGEEKEFFAEARVNGESHLAMGDTELIALVSTMPPIQSHQAHMQLKELREFGLKSNLERR